MLDGVALATNALATNALAVSTLAVSTLAVSTLAVSTLAISPLATSALATSALAINALTINALALSAYAIAPGIRLGHPPRAESCASLPWPQRHRQACVARQRGPAAGVFARGHLVGSGAGPVEHIKP